MADGAVFTAWSPLEVGDVVRMKSRDICLVTDILTIHRAKDNEVVVNYELDGRCIVPLSYIACRVVDGRDVAIADEKVASEKVAVR